MAKKRKNEEEDSGSQKSTKADGNDGSGSSNAIPIFLKKTYRMIESCNPEICTWTEDGEMFVVRNPVRA